MGLLVGVYALTQMILQMPFGILSDKIGRKNHAHWTDYFYNRLFNLLFCRKYLHHAFRRMLQGAGAIGAVATAMISDFITEENRGKAMAVMGSL